LQARVRSFEVPNWNLERQARRSRMRGTFIFAVVAFTSCLLQPRTAIADTVNLPFWAGPGAKADRRVVEIYDHPACTGRVAVARLNKMPRPTTKGPLQPELVVELSDTGTVLRQWSMPIDTVVAGIKKDQILVPLPRENYKSGKAILISTQGDLSMTSMTTVPKGAPDRAVFPCPPIREFGKSDYLRCFEFHDLESGELRRLAFQGPCT